MHLSSDIISSILKEEGLKPAQFAKSIGVVPTQVYDLQSGKTKKISDSIAKKIISIYPKYNKIWLLTGEGDMLKKPNTKDPAVDYATKNKEIEFEMVPVLHIDSVGGMHSSNAICDESTYTEGYVPFTDARPGDICIVQSGNSMVPTCPSGSLLLLREVNNWKEYFGYGNIFVLELKDGRRITKEVTRYDSDPEKYVWCISHNPEVPKEELPKSMIKSVWKVIKILTDIGW